MLIFQMSQIILSSVNYRNICQEILAPFFNKPLQLKMDSKMKGGCTVLKAIMFVGI